MKSIDIYLNQLFRISFHISDILLRRWKSFDVYVKKGFNKIYAVRVDANWRSESKCTCPFFLKCYVCKHVLGMALRLQLAKCPKNAVPTVIEKEPKRGRKTLATRALLRQ